MGKIGKPQRSRKQKKIKAIDPFYHGDRKGVRSKDLNQTPKSLIQEIPKKLKRLGYIIDDAKNSGGRKKSKNKFLTPEQGSVKYDSKFGTPLGSKSPESKPAAISTPSQKPQKKKKQRTPKHSADMTKEPGKKGKKSKFKQEDVEEYIDNLKPNKPFVEPFQFKRRNDESQAKFMRRVDRETNVVLAKAKIDEQYDVDDEKKIGMMVKAKKSKLNEKKKQRLADKKKLKAEVLKEKKQEKLTGFNALQDKVEFGDVVHAPPVLTVRPKKAVDTMGVDKPGLRMPELKEAIIRNMAESANGVDVSLQRQRGQTVKRKALSSGQQVIADARRNEFIEAYRQLKVKKAKIK
ncbi:coiled-coil domain-containing protein 137 [Aplysia californica]|uniref:Coiled-coil domain-containing protein 137 n=1 Tax=Aplysia californica TaxID=6500 RepID=A0ABM0JT48_APLCA|nr:coiled-coil domain-containing protein 137 [Aplysia californica]